VSARAQRADAEPDYSKALLVTCQHCNGWIEMGLPELVTAKRLAKYARDGRNIATVDADVARATPHCGCAK
jgi:hypothetical protein